MEETWRNRCRHRQNGVCAVKRGVNYIIAEASGIHRPKSPDPQDRRLSKREWEKTVQRWRLELLSGVKALSTDAIMEVGALRLVRGAGRMRTLRLSAKCPCPPRGQKATMNHEACVRT